MAATITQNSKPLHPRALDTSGNNNHGTAYTGQALEFDGVADYVHGALDGNPGDFGSQSDLELTIAFWYNPSDVSLSDGVVSWSRSGQPLDGSTFLLLSQNGSGQLRYYINHSPAYTALSTVFESNTWYRIVLTRTASDNTWRSYVNGVADSTKDDTGTPGSQANADVFYVGSGYGGYFTGMLSDCQVWNKPFTQSDVTYDYLNPETLALDTPSTSLTYSNLKLWYPMQDGTRGGQINLMDGANTGLGSETLTNGDFSDASVSDTWNGSSEVALVGWGSGQTHTADNHAIITDGKCRLISTGSNIDIRQDGSLIVGQTYYYSIEVTNVTSGYITLNAGYDVLDATDIGTYTGYFTATNDMFYIKRNGSGGVCDVTFDNVSVKAINAKNHGASKFYGEQLWANDEALLSTDYGSELITNGTMEADSNWADRNIGGGESNTRSTEQAHNGTYSRKIVATANDSGCRSDNFNVVAGRAYLVECYVYVVSGTCRIQRAGGHVNVTESSTGTGAWEKLSGVATSSSTTTESFKIVADGGASTFYVDDVSVKEIGSTSELRTGSEIASGALTYNKWYEITARDGIDFTTYGAPDNNIGTKFLLSHADGSSVPTMDSNDKAWLLDFGWAGYAGNTYSITEEEDALRIKLTQGSTVTNGMYIYFKSANTEFASAFAIGREYKLTLKLKVSSGDDVNATIYDGASSTNLGTYNNTTFGTVNVTFTAKHATNAYFKLGSLSAGDEVWISDFSIIEQGIATGWTDADAQPTIPQLGFQSYNQLAWFSGLPNDTLVDINADTTLASGTYSFWAISDMSTANGKNTVFGHGNYQHGCFSMNWSSNMPILRTGSNQYVFWDDNAAQDDGKWHHWVVYLDHSTITDSKLYIDGVLQSQNTTAATGSHIAWAEGLNIGAEKADPLYPFIGCITEFSWWNKELSLAEAQELYNDGEALDATLHSSAANLSGYWRNQGATTWTDLSTNSNNGTATSVTEYLTLPEGNNGRDTQGFLMNRERVGLNLPYVSNEEGAPRIEYGKISELNSAATFSIEMWVRPIDTNTQQFLFTHWGGTNERIDIELDTKLFLHMYNSTSNNGYIRYTAADASISAGTWTHLVWTFNGGRTMNSGSSADAADMSKLYANGVLVGTLDDVSSESFATTTASMPAAVTSIGCQRTSNADSSTYYRSFKGDMDDVNIYSSELTANQVARNYKAGKRRHRS